ncbi:MAG TPA: hypothetical protein VIV40_02560 [Kofleriaceae bacterium]
MKSLLVAALLVPTLSTVAHAEYIAPRRSELRQPAAQKTAVKPERVLTRISMKQPVETAPAARGLEVQDVLSKINGPYMFGVQRCYRKTLAIDPSVSGKVDLQFTVAADGHVTSALRGEGFGRCLNNLMSNWRFGVALDDSGNATDASFRISLVLQSN